MLALNATTKITLLLGIPLFVSGCASIGMAYVLEGAYNDAFRTKIEDASRLPEQAQLRLREVKFIESLAGLTPKGEVVGLACKGTVAWLPELNETNGKTPEEAARTQLLLKAMQRGANAVAASSCTHNEWIDWGNNCWESWVCAGQAVSVP